jgi:tRNA threonylcarbamoyl adenosine modification protein YeaZ
VSPSNTSTPVPLILAIDTTQPHGSIALIRNNTLLEEEQLHTTTGFAEILYPALQNLLARNNVKLAEIDLYAVAAGPGSFTGVRIGLAAAKGCAEMHGRLVVPISNLLAIAALANLSRPMCPVIDVRRGEFAAAVYSATLDELRPPFSATPAEIIATSGDVTYCGPDAPASFPNAIETSRALAATIARLAATRPGLDPSLADAEYVRRADVRLPVAK